MYIRVSGNRSAARAGLHSDGGVRRVSDINYDLASGMAGATHDRKHFLQGHTWQRQEHISGQFIGKPNPTRLNPPVPVIINLGPAADECGAEQVADVHAYDT